MMRIALVFCVLDGSVIAPSQCDPLPNLIPVHLHYLVSCASVCLYVVRSKKVSNDSLCLLAVGISAADVVSLWQHYPP